MTAAPMTGPCVELVHRGHLFRRRALEMPGERWTSWPTDDDWQQAAVLANSRLRRCRPGTWNWLWYHGVLEEAARRQRARLSIVPSDR